jgi:hypothetical protein
MDEARASAISYVRSLPSADRVLLVRADGLATPAGVLESDHAAIERAIRESRPGSSALNLQQAFDFARQFERVHATLPGEIVFVGAGKIPAGEPVSAPPAALRVLQGSTHVDNVGLRKVGLKRSETDPSAWEVFVAARNYGTAERVVPLELRFAGAIVGARSLVLKPGIDEGATFTVRTRAAGLLEARLIADDALPEDNRSAVELPAQRALKVVVYSPQPESLRPVLAANPHVAAEFLQPSAYAGAQDADVVILDEFAPPMPPSVPTIWIEPPARGAPVRTTSTITAAKLKTWNPAHELAAGLRTRDLDIGTTAVFSAEPGDIVVAEIDQGPVIMAREAKPNEPQFVAFGFHPVRSGMRYQLATPILFANVLRWMHPEIFRRWELNSGPVGSVATQLESDIDPAKVTVRSDSGAAVPYTIDTGQLRFFAGAPGNVTVTQGDREIVYSLTLPELGDISWSPPVAARRGIPKRNPLDSAPTDLWPWLALLGAVGLTTEWMLWGRGQRRIRTARKSASLRERPHWWRRKAS